MSEVEGAEEVRRRFAAEFRTPLEELADQPVARLRRLLALVDEQRALYAELGFEAPDEAAA